MLRMVAWPWRRGGILGALGVALLFLSTGCFEDTTQPEQGAAPATEAALLPTLAQIREAVPMSDAEAEKLGPALERWQSAERSRDTADEPFLSPALEFLADSATFLDRAQVLALAHVIRTQREARFADGEHARPGDRFGRHGDRRPGMGPGRFGHPPFADLDLTDAQRAAIRTAMQSMHAAVQAARQVRRDGGSEEAFRAAVDAARATFQAALQEILTPEQYAQLQQGKKDRLIQHLERRLERHEAHAARLLGILTRILGLDEAQVQAIAAVQAQAATRLGEILAGLRDGSLDLEAAHTALGDLRTQTHDAIVAALTSEQAALFEELTALLHRRGHRGPRG